MHKTLSDKLLVLCFILLLLAFPLYWLVVKDKDFSPNERRNLASLPELGQQKLQSWDYDDKIENYLSDQLPLRNVWVGIYKYYNYITGRQISSRVYVDREGYLIEPPIEASQEDIDKRMGRIQALQEKTDLPCYLLAPPSTGYVREAYLPLGLGTCYKDADYIAQMKGYKGIELVELLPLFAKEGQTWFYRNDRHWTEQGAYAAYCAFMDAKGALPLDHEHFCHHKVQGYRGSTYSRSALWLSKGEELVLTEPMIAVELMFSDREGVYDSLLFWDNLQGYDWYTVFEDGNHPITTVHNKESHSGEVLLLVKDSFANSRIPLLLPLL